MIPAIQCGKVPHRPSGARVRRTTDRTSATSRMPTGRAEARLLPTKAIGGGDMNKILVATDGSDSAAEAVEFGIELAAEHEAELILVHVVPALDIVPASGFGIGGRLPSRALARRPRAPRARSGRCRGARRLPDDRSARGRHRGRDRRLRRFSQRRSDRRGIARSRRDRQRVARKRLAGSPGGVEAARDGRPRRSLDPPLRRRAPARRDRDGLLIDSARTSSRA